jgi:hypothetical protein
MIVRGVDPGPAWLSWCDLTFATGKPVFVAMGELPAESAMSVLDGADVIAIEIAMGLRQSCVLNMAQLKATVRDLLLTNRVADRIVHEARRRGVRVFEVDQDAARRGIGVQPHLGGKGPSKMELDKQVEVCVRGLVGGFPVARRDSNPDKRDAAVYSMHGGYLLACEQRSKEA